MCLIVFAVAAHPELPLVVLANRDEYYDRPAAGARFWADAPEVFAGRDLEHGGTWLGVTTAGRFAALTNVRAPLAARLGRSRGALVREALASHASPKAWGEAIDRPHYPAFNLLFGHVRELYYAHDASAEVQRVSAGIHGLSNARLDEPWPKVSRARARLERLLTAPALDLEAAFAILSDPSLAADNELPSTGVPLELERALSAAFIAMPGYGTRASTVLSVRRDGVIRFVERTYGVGGVSGEATDVTIYPST